MTTPTPRTDAIKKLFRDAINEPDRERQIAMREGAECGIEALERDLAAAQEARQAAEARAEQNAKDAERWRYWRANPSKWASAPVETLSSWKTPKQLDRDTDAAIAGEPK